MERITEKMLERKIQVLNKITGSPGTAYTCSGGRLVTNVGHFYLDKAYGGYALERMNNEGGGVSNVFNCGHVPKRDLFNRICAFIDGLEFARGQ